MPTEKSHSAVRGFAVTGLLMATAIIVVGQLYGYLPLMPAIAGALSTGDAVAGLTVTVFAFAQAAGFFVVGLVNRAVSGRVLLAGGLAALAASSLAAAFFLSLGYAPGFFAARGLQGLAAAVFPPVALAAIVDVNAPQHRPIAIGLLSACLLMSAPLGQLIASETAAHWSASGVFVASAAALIVIAGLVASARFAGHKAPRPAERPASTPSLLRPAALGRFYLTSFSLLFGVVFYYASIQASHAVPDLQVFRLAGTPAVLMTLVTARLLHRLSAPSVQAIGLAVAAAGAFLSGLPAGPAMLQAGHWLVLGGVATATPALLSFVGQQAAGIRAQAIMLYSFVIFAGAGLGAPIANAVAGEPLGLQMALLAAIYAAAAASAASYRLRPLRIDARSEAGAMGG